MPVVHPEGGELSAHEPTTRVMASQVNTQATTHITVRLRCTTLPTLWCFPLAHTHAARRPPRIGMASTRDETDTQARAERHLPWVRSAETEAQRAADPHRTSGCGVKYWVACGLLQRRPTSSAGGEEWNALMWQPQWRVW
jgi:hypothetical protein